jgi:hypothetical protein
MTMAKIKSIPKAAAPGSLSNEVIARIDEARATLYEAQSLLDVARAASLSEDVDAHSMQTTLRHVFNDLNHVASLIEPAALEQLATEA